MTFNREDTWVCVAFFLPLSLEEGLVADSTGCCEFLLSSSTILTFSYTPDHCSCSALLTGTVYLLTPLPYLKRWMRSPSHS